MNKKLLEAESFRKLEKHQVALSLYEEILQESPNAEALQGAAYCAYHLHQLDEASRYSDLALRSDSRLAIPHVKKAGKRQK